MARRRQPFDEAEDARAFREREKKARGKSRYEGSVGHPGLEEARAKNLAREILRLQRAGLSPEEASSQALRMIQGRVAGAYGLSASETHPDSWRVVSDRSNQFLQGHQKAMKPGPVAQPAAAPQPRATSKGSLYDPTMTDPSKIPLQRAAKARYGVTPRGPSGNLPLSSGASQWSPLPTLATGNTAYSGSEPYDGQVRNMEPPGLFRKILLGLRDGWQTRDLSRDLSLPSRSPGRR